MAQPIRVLCVFSTLDRGGAESMCMNIYRKLDRSKVQFDFIKHTPSKGSFEDEILSLGGRIFTLPAYRVYNHLGYLRKWKAFLRAHPEIRIIHAHFFTVAPIFFKIAKKYGCVTISHSHCTWDSRHMTLARRIKKRILSHIEDNADHCFACSEDAGKWLYPSRAYKVVNNAVDSRLFTRSAEKRQRMRAEFNLKDSLTIGHVGNFSTVKNHRFLVNVFKLIHDRVPNSRLIMVGGGMSAEVEKQVGELGLSDSVIFTGVRGDVADVLQAFDAFAFPSFSEGLPVTVVEAQAAGLKCFISDAVTREVDLTRRCVFLPIDDPKLWAERILDEDLTVVDTSEQIVSAGYDINTTAKWFEDFYLSL